MYHIHDLVLSCSASWECTCSTCNAHVFYQGNAPVAFSWFHLAIVRFSPLNCTMAYVLVWWTQEQDFSWSIKHTKDVVEGLIEVGAQVQVKWTKAKSYPAQILAIGGECIDKGPQPCVVHCRYLKASVKLSGLTTMVPLWLLFVQLKFFFTTIYSTQWLVRQYLKITKQQVHLYFQSQKKI